jgi:acyl-CoA synthetase (NDP forming)
VDVADYVSYLAEDPNCKSIACIFEGVESPERLLQAAEYAWEANKPLVMYKLGTSDQGAAAAMSHSGFLAGSVAAYKAAFERMGAIVAENIRSFLETASFFAKAPAPKADGVAVITTSGGFGVLTADMAERYGVSMPQPEGDTLALLKKHVPEFGAARNPCDATAQVMANPQMLIDCTEAFFADPSYTALIYPHPYAYEGGQERVWPMRDLGKKYGKPMIVAWITNWLEGPDTERIEADPDLVLFRSMDNCYFCLAAWVHREKKRQAWLKEKGRKAGRISPADAKERAGKLIDAAKNKALTEREAKEVLAIYGVPVVGEKLVQTAEEAAAAAKTLGFPVALKVESPDLPHKTEAGVIRLGMKNEAEVKAAFDAVMANAKKVSPPPRLNGVLVQPMISAGTEIMVGARVDPLFGPLVITGLGGILVELMKDTAVDLAPVTAPEARAMLDSLKGKAALTGFRGSEPVDLGKLSEIVARLSEFVADQKERVAELDVNPLICSGGRITAVDALIVKKG